MSNGFVIGLFIVLVVVLFFLLNIFGMVLFGRMLIFAWEHPFVTLGLILLIGWAIKRMITSS